MKIQANWLGVEATKNQLPCLMRVRIVPPEVMQGDPRQHLLVVARAYVTEEASGLPDGPEYDRISRFEESVVDPLEASGLGLLAFTSTNDGSTEYFIYVKDLDQAAAFISSMQPLGDSVEISGVENDNWNEYQSMRATIAEDE